MAEDPEHGVLYLSIATLFGAYLSVRIRLKRFGKIRAPFYRIVVADSRTKRDGRVIEEIGKYHPTRDPSYIDVNSERAQYWLSKGAQPSDPVLAILKLTGDWGKFSGVGPTASQVKESASSSSAHSASNSSSARDPDAQDVNTDANTDHQPTKDQ